jgi:hypothetical protein
LTRNPTLRVLSILRRHRVRALLMGGQACIVYGAAQFSRDVDVAVAVDPENLRRLRAALAELQAEPACFQRFTATALRRGHACHFKCHAGDLGGFRLDVRSVMRGAPTFATLWRRRIALAPERGVEIHVMALPDLVRVKKTKRDKDWPMVRLLVENDVARAPSRVPREQAMFWLRECRTPDLLIDLAERFPRLAVRESATRPAVGLAVAGDRAGIERELRAEEDRERELDSQYWRPRLAELEALRLGRRRRRPPR